MKNIKYILTAALTLFGVFTLRAAADADFRIGRNAEIMLNMFRDINIFYVDPVDSDKLMSDVAQGMTKNLDPYTEYISEEDMPDFEVVTTGKYGGIGSLIRKKGDWVTIAEPYKGSPADKAGLVIGDKIVEIAGQNAKGFETSKVSSLLKGEPGSKVSLKVEKFGTGKVVDLNIKRERISIPGIPYYGFVSDSVGYIQHTEFTEGCADDMRRAILDMKKSGKLSALILDYRFNGGGILQEAVKVLSMFVPKGTEVVSMKGRRAQMDATFSTETQPIESDIPIIVLTNSGSASAAEIVSGAIQDLDRGLLLGTRTFGKGLVQSTRPLGYNSYLKVTTAKYYIPSGRCIQAIDYAHRNEDGSVGFVPDSLIKEFKTAAGRKVYDGGGVMPDVVTKPDYGSRFVMLLYANGFIDDFVDSYMVKHPEKVDAVGFTLPEGVYKDFITFMEDKEVVYESQTKQSLEKLLEQAQRERYDEQIKDLIVQAKSRIKDDKKSSLNLHKDEITELIEEQIVLRGNYRHGVTQRTLSRDKDVLRATEILKDGEYGKLLLKDTQRVHN